MAAAEVPVAIVDISAVAYIGGIKFQARIMQFEEAAYVAVWGNGDDVDAKVTSRDALLLMVEVAKGIQPAGIGDHDASVLRQAAAVFALDGNRVERAPWGSHPQ